MNHRFQFTFFLFLLSLFVLPTTFLHSEDANEKIAPQEHLETSKPKPVDKSDDTLFNLQQPDLLQSDEIDPNENHFVADFAKMLVTLGLLISLLLFVSWYLKRMMQSKVQNLNSSSYVKVIEQRQLSARSTIHIVEVEGKTLVIGESHGNICLLTELPSTPESFS